MSVPRSWLENGAAAARLAGGKGDLWLAGTLGALPWLGWLPLVVTVSAVPRTSDLAFTGADLLSSSLFPLNVILISIVAALAVLVACLVASLAEASLLRAQALGTPDRSMAREVEVTFSVMLLAVLPAVAVGAALVSGVAAVAPAVALTRAGAEQRDLDLLDNPEGPLPPRYVPEFGDRLRPPRVAARIEQHDHTEQNARCQAEHDQSHGEGLERRDLRDLIHEALAGRRLRKRASRFAWSTNAPSSRTPFSVTS